MRPSGDQEGPQSFTSFEVRVRLPLPSASITQTSQKPSSDSQLPLRCASKAMNRPSGENAGFVGHVRGVVLKLGLHIVAIQGLDETRDDRLVPPARLVGEPLPLFEKRHEPSSALAGERQPLGCEQARDVGRWLRRKPGLELAPRLVPGPPGLVDFQYLRLPNRVPVEDVLGNDEPAHVQGGVEPVGLDDPGDQTIPAHGDDLEIEAGADRCLPFTELLAIDRLHIVAEPPLDLGGARDEAQESHKTDRNCRHGASGIPV